MPAKRIDHVIQQVINLNVSLEAFINAVEAQRGHKTSDADALFAAAARAY